jgi:transcription elongation factor Elf1
VSENVKPCPFCGHVGISLAEGTTYRWRVAECSECGARCGEIRVQTSGAGTRQEWEAVGVVNAIEEWNKRTEPADLAEARRDVEALREMVDSTKVAAWDKCAEIIRRAQTAEAERDALLHTVMEVRGILHACGRRPEACHEMSILDAAIDAARKETP